jgi:hypothetical protein
VELFNGIDFLLQGMRNRLSGVRSTVVERR